jgi:hypothetical protein
MSRVQKLFERLSSGGAVTAAELEGAVARQHASRRLAGLDPRYRLVQLLEASPAPVVDAIAVRKLASSLRPEAAVIARVSARSAPATGGKTPSLH